MGVGLQEAGTVILKQIKSMQGKGFWHLLSVNYMTQLLGFGSVILVSKFLTPIEVGQMKIIQSYAQFFVVIGMLGLNTACLKFCAERIDESRREYILRTALLRGLASSVVSVALLAILVKARVIASAGGLGTWLLIYSAVIPILVVSNILVVYLQALKRIKEMAGAQALVKLQSFVLIVLATWKWGFGGFVFAGILAYLLGMLTYLRQVGLDFFRSREAAIPNGFNWVAGFALLSTAVAQLGNYADVFVLDRFCPDRRAVGLYSLATLFVLAAMQITATAQSVSTPYFSERCDDEKWFRRTLLVTQLKMTGVSIVVAGLVYLMGWGLVTIFYGPEYNAALRYLPILLLRYVVWSSCAITGVAQLGLGREDQNFVAAAVATPVGLASSYLLLRSVGIEGVAWAQVASAAVNLVLVTLLARRSINSRFAKPKSPARTSSE